MTGIQAPQQVSLDLNETACSGIDENPVQLDLVSIMFRKDRLSSLLRHQQDNYKSKTPEPPPRDDERASYSTIKSMVVPDPSSIVFEPYVSSSSSASDNDSLSEEIVPVYYQESIVIQINVDNLEQLELDSDYSIQTSGPISPHICDVCILDLLEFQEDIKKYEHLSYFPVLKQTIFFDTIFSSDERDAIMQNIVQVDYPKDAILFSQGELPSYLYIIVDGTVEYIQTDVKGNSNTLQRLYHFIQVLILRYTGSVIGEADIYNNNRYEYYCVTCESVIIVNVIYNQVIVLRLTATFVKQLISENHRYELVLE